MNELRHRAPEPLITNTELPAINESRRMHSEFLANANELRDRALQFLSNTTEFPTTKKATQNRQSAISSSLYSLITTI